MTDTWGASASRIGGGTTASASTAIKRCPSRVQAPDVLLWTNTRMPSRTPYERVSLFVQSGWETATCGALLLVSARPRNQVGVSIHGCHPPFEHHPTRARRGEPVAVPCWLGGVGGQG